MKIKLSKEQYISLVKMIYLGNWLANAHRLPDDRDKEMDDIAQHIYSYATDFDADDLLHHSEISDKVFPTRELEETLHGDYVDGYDIENFWDTLIDEFAKRDFLNEYGEENIVILGRYNKQIKNIQKIIGKKAKIVKMSFDGKHLLKNTDIFIGSGGTMTAESALMGILTILYNATPNIIENFLVKKYLVKRETKPNGISNHIKKKFNQQIMQIKEELKKL